jgi:hypothetical protein
MCGNGVRDILVAYPQRNSTIGTFDVPQLPVVGGVYGDTWVYTEVTALDGDGSDYAVNVILQ